MQTIIPHNKIFNRTPPEINIPERALPHYTILRRLLAQLHTNKSLILHAFLHKITPETHPTPNCPPCQSQAHDTKHIFGCPRGKGADGPGPRSAMGRYWGEGGSRSAGPLVGSAGVGPGAEMRGRSRVVSALGRQQQ